MLTILLFGAGKSATVLIDYLGKCSDENQWNFLVCDSNLELAQSKVKKFSTAKAISANVADDSVRQELISNADMVISMLPPTLHFSVAKDCVYFSKNLLTASYIDDSIRELENEIKEKGLLFLGEMGLDPGIDHMSAMQMIDTIKNEGGEIKSFKSHCGGLVSPESDDNPWHYKITWNPKNVVTAGSAGARFLENTEIVKLSYKDIFNDDENRVDIPGLSPLAWYANRDSLSYIDTYNLQGIPTFIRTTLRYPSFCTGWNKIVQLDFANTSDHAQLRECKTLRDWFLLKKNIFFELNKNSEEAIILNPGFLEQVEYLGMQSEEPLPPGEKNSSDILQYLLEKKLVMKPHDKDMIIMLHEIEYVINTKTKKLRSCLIVKGEDQLYTAMAKTVGLPLGIAAKLILQKKIKLIGIHIPVIPEIYEPVLDELSQNGIVFVEEYQS